ncbi:hypothetical protein K435DRAFT_873954 [Dendrothele bispora CBS 962.96]|uniref:Mid2 domain-containing protein n=1 Tax=Dendrothele bispora (strain CBS 962.96) TaxID=1314807 RepID=A0A4S8KXT1_DENBC|nr:hypothetical protein K435DRAFT_873954 [Dendrothele bispora CBS 962.96]
MTLEYPTTVRCQVTSTSSVIPPGTTIISNTTSDSSNFSSSSSNPGAIVGGVVGGVIGLIASILLTWGIMRWRRNCYNGALDGNFDPDHPNPLMAQLNDDGMGGCLNASTVGGGIVAPYPLYHPSSASPTSPTSPSPLTIQGRVVEVVTGILITSIVMDLKDKGRHPSPGPSLAGTNNTDLFYNHNYSLPPALAAAGVGAGAAGGQQ